MNKKDYKPKFINDDKITFKTLEVAGIVTAILRMRNPLNSWGKSDSYWIDNNGFVLTPFDRGATGEFHIGEDDKELAQRLISAGAEHCKFLRQIYVSFDAVLPRYVWSEFDTYHFNTKNSCSTMHTLLSAKNPLTTDQFVYCIGDSDWLEHSVSRINYLAKQYRGEYPTQMDKADIKRRAKQILPEGFLQRRTVSTSYAELRNMYFQRRNHALSEWNTKFTEWIKTLPYAKELIMYEK
ncbi:MAG: Thymidylate synthase complementing protein [Bacteriophage sp.]|nr:MAG: Thymidylate synthase complementing protein [Bacteriophage sp.]